MYLYVLPQKSYMTTSNIHLLQFIMAVFLTLASLTYTFWDMTNWPKSYELVSDAATVYVEDTQIPKEILWTGTQVVTKVHRLGDELVPIEVDAVSFRTEEDVLSKSNQIPLVKEYIQEIELDGEGNVTKIKFKSKGA